jgi:parallel beta-helix repeat protein
MLTSRKLACLALTSIILLSSLFFINSAHATDVASLISSDTTWTLSGSPYTLTGPTAVGKGVTLTIEPGVTVNINDYYLQVNGTLIAQGSSSQRIAFNGGRIVFTEVSNGWSRQGNTGHVIEYATLTNTNIESIVGVKLDHDIITASVILGGNSVVSNSEITNEYATVVGDACTVSSNALTGSLRTGDNAVISHNILKPHDESSQNGEPELSTGRSSTISDNTIMGVHVLNQFQVYDNALRTGAQSAVTNNKITGVLTGSPSEIKGNTIEGGGTSSSWDMRSSSKLFAVRIDSETCKFSSNTITGTTGAAVSAKTVSFISNSVVGGVEAQDGSEFKNNVVSGRLQGGGLFQNNRVYGSITLTGSSTIAGNYIESGGGINTNNYASIIEDNTIKGGGIFDAAGTIQHNLITDAYYGISTGTQPVTIQANTITKNTVGIYVGSNAPTISGNNIEGNTQNSIALTVGGDVEAADNWWGTTDTQAISNSIHDFKNDFNLGNVNYQPILTEPNAQAKPKENPNLPSPPPPTQKPTPPTATPIPGIHLDKSLTDSMLEAAIFLFVLLILLAVVLIAVAVFINRKKQPK